MTDHPVFLTPKECVFLESLIEWRTKHQYFPEDRRQTCIVAMVAGVLFWIVGIVTTMIPFFVVGVIPAVWAFFQLTLSSLDDPVAPGDLANVRQALSAEALASLVEIADSRVICLMDLQQLIDNNASHRRDIFNADIRQRQAKVLSNH